MEMTSNFSEWTKNSMYTAKKDLLMTLAYIHDNRARDNAKAYSSQQLDDVKDIFETIHCMCEIKKHMTE